MNTAPARMRMTHRALVEMNAASGNDVYNNPPPPDWQPWQTVPCFAWSQTRKEIEPGDKIAVLEDLRMIVPKSATITEKNRVAKITDRLGVDVFPGPFAIDGVMVKGTHQEVVLRGVS